MKVQQNLQQLTAYATRFSLVRRMMRLAIRAIVPQFRIGAAVVLFDERGRVLLLEHPFHGRYPWSLPGGWVDRGETPDATVERELWEETRLKATIGPAIHFDRTNPGFSQNIFFEATDHEGEIALSFEATAYDWFEMDKLPRSKMLPNTRHAIAIGHERFLARTQAAIGVTA